MCVNPSQGIEHFRHGKAALAARLSDGLVLMHPFVSGELDTSEFSGALKQVFVDDQRSSHMH